MRKKILFIFLLVAVAAYGSRAQLPSAPVFSRLTKKEGLLSNTVFGTVQDQQGFLWIATQNGLQRYDGHRFLSFRHIPGNSSSIPANTINHLYLDSRQRLWLLFDKYTGIFNTQTLSFSKAAVDSNVSMIKKITADGEGRLILFADNKMLVYDETDHSFRLPYLLPAVPAGYTIADMTVDTATGLYWFTGRQGSLLYDPKAKQFYSGKQNSIHHPALAAIGSVTHARYPFITPDGDWWMVNWIPFSASPPALYRYNKKDGRATSFEKIRPYKTADTYYEIWNVFRQSNGTVWIYGMGLFDYYSPAQKRFIHISSDAFRQSGIEYDYVSRLYEDREKNIWVSTNNGLYRFNPEAQVFDNISNKRPGDTAAVHQAVSAIVQTRSNGIWVSTWGGGVFSYNDQWQPAPNPVTTADPRNKWLHAGCMIQRRNGEIWIGTQTGELKIYDPVANRCYSLSLSLLKNEIITQLLEDHAGNTWIGTGAGLLVKCSNGNWRDTAGAFTATFPPLGDIMRLYEDRLHHIWVCTASHGVYEIDEEDRVIQTFKEGADTYSGLLNEGASDMVQYNDSIYLFASDGLCIYNNRTKQFRYLTPADGLPAEHITSLIVDKQQRLWVALDGGLYRLNIDNRLYVSYGIADGIRNDILQVASASVLADGRIAIGTPRDFLVFDPGKTIDTHPSPVVAITGFVLGDRRLAADSLQQLKKLTLAYNNTFLRIELSTLRFRDDHPVYYRLEGLDKEWKRVDNYEIAYPYLPPGHYTLQLKSVNSEGAESRLTQWRIQVTPPFWQTAWFYCLVLLLIGALLFWLDHRRIQRKTAVLKMRSDIADNLHRDVSAALGNITILSKMATLKADTEPGKSKAFIEEIHTKSENMTLAMDDMLWSINPDNDSMAKLVSRFREYVSAMKTQYDVQVDVLADKKAEVLPLLMNQRSDLLWLFKGGIKTVLRTGGQNCRIHITYEKPYIRYTLEFDTSATDMQQLHNLRQRGELSAKLKETGAQLDFQVHKSSAVFLLSIPLKG